MANTPKWNHWPHSQLPWPWRLEWIPSRCGSAFNMPSVSHMASLAKAVPEAGYGTSAIEYVLPTMGR